MKVKNINGMSFGCVWHEDRWTGMQTEYKPGCSFCAEAKRNLALYLFWRQAVNVNVRILSFHDYTDQQLGEFCRDNAAILDHVRVTV